MGDAAIRAGGDGHAESPHHPIGAKGVGESATVGSPAAYVNAVIDALSHLGITNIDMPITSDKVWAALRSKGVPPGTGKTLLARAVAGEAGVPFFSISGSDFVEMFVGVGASRVRDLFEQAKQNSPCIIFMDEIDAVGRHRGAGLGGGHDKREQTLNQLLVEMDGFEMKDNIILIAATDRADILDPALLRPAASTARSSSIAPTGSGRKKILEVHTRGKPLGREIDVDALAGQTPGFTGADCRTSSTRPRCWRPATASARSPRTSSRKGSCG